MDPKRRLDDESSMQPNSLCRESKDISTIDFANFERGDTEQRKAIGTAITDAFQRQGFLRLINHGISRQTVEELFEWSKCLFSLPDEVKEKAAHPAGPIPHRGWTGVGIENTSIFGQQEKNGVILKDFKESFDQGSAQDPLYGNIWLPENELPGFRTFMEKYYLTCYRCQLQILEAVELGLGLPLRTLTKRHTQQENEMRLTHYPAIPAANLHPDANATRIAKHTDFGSITLLFQDSVGGLEIENPTHTGRYDPVVSKEIDEMIVNVGDCLQRWSNDRLRSTRHRVHLPQHLLDVESAILPARFSVAYFSKPDRNCSVRSMPEMCEDEEQLYDDVTAGEFLLQRSWTGYPDVD